MSKKIYYFLFCLFLVFNILNISCAKDTNSKESVSLDKNIPIRQEAKIYVVNPIHDFGKIKQGTVVRHSFVIKNAGKEDLIISRVRPSCGCTAAVPKKNVLKKGEETTIDVEFDSAGREGKQRKSIYVFSNDKENPKLKLLFKAYIKK